MPETHEAPENSDELLSDPDRPDAPQESEYLPIPHPKTGELLSFDAPTDELAGYRVAIQDILKEILATLDAELLSRMDAAAKWSVTVDINGHPYKIQAPSPTAGTTEYEPEILWNSLRHLEEDGVIDRAAVAAAAQIVRPASFVKVKQAGVNALLKTGNPRVIEAIESAKRTVEPSTRSVRIRRTA